MTIYLSSEPSGMEECIEFGNWYYQDTVYCYEQCWVQDSKDYEIWVHKNILAFRYYYDKKNTEIGYGEVEKFIDFTINSTLATPESLSKSELANWQKFKTDKTYNIDTFLDLWNPKLKRLDKVEEWDAWYEKTHRE